MGTHPQSIGELLAIFATSDYKCLTGMPWRLRKSEVLQSTQIALRKALAVADCGSTAFGGGAVSARSAVESCLARIRELDDQLHATITVMEDEALAFADACDAAAAAGQWLGLLHGMPVAVKDNIDTAGVRTTSGSRFFAERVPSTDATVVSRLRAAGAVLVAKVNMAEFAFGATTQNPHYGGCRNPWDPSRIPGGSSGGSAAAVAAGMAAGALGTDTGGSVRLPASVTGLVGLRPTFGRVPNTGTTPVSSNFDTVGPLAHTVRDVARLLVATQGYDPADDTSVNGRLDPVFEQLERGIEGMRIGVLEPAFFGSLHPGVEGAVRAALDVLEGLGARLEVVDLPGAEEAQVMAQRIIYPDIASFHAERIAEAPELFGADVLARMQLGAAMSATDYAGAQRWRLGWVRRIEELFTQVDLLAAPTSPLPPPPADDSEMIPITHAMTTTTYPWSLANMPSVSVPCGFAAGLPVGLHLSGPAWHDGRVLRAAAAYQSATRWHLERPALLGGGSPD
jgi:aspartyl-tRNA(Asn)/glutamyl-tRNA(Gln) amidotransferase subunit A